MVLLNEFIFIVIQLLLIVGIHYLYVKLYPRKVNLNLTKTEEENFIDSYVPESLVEDIPNCDYTLKPSVVKGKNGEFIDIDGTKCVNFATHDYLGLIGKKEIEDKAIESIEKYGVGTCGPRCFYGTNIEHLKLETKLADFLSTESSIIYPFGFATVASAMPAYAKKGDIVFVDEKRNFAIQQGLVASRSDVIYFKHNNYEDLETILRRLHDRHASNMNIVRKSRRFLVLEGIYINTGEICHLPKFLMLSKMYKLRVFIDESISFGVLGRTGRGILEHFDIPRAEVDLTMGSFEHSLASGGGFCAGSKYLIEHQVLSGLGYCFSAALPPCLVTAASEALDTIRDNPEIIKTLKICCQTMHDKLTSSELIKKYFVISGETESPVHLLAIRDDMFPEHQLQSKDQLLNDFVESFRKQNIAIVRAASLKTDDTLQASLRITTSVYHSEARIENLVTVLQNML